MRQRTRWRLLLVLAVVALVPAAIAGTLVSRSPGDPSRAFAIPADGSKIDLGLAGRAARPGTSTTEAPSSGC